MADLNALIEAEQRGILPPEMQGMLDEARKRGLIETPRAKWGVGESINNIVNQLGTGVFKGIAGVAGLPNLLAKEGSRDKEFLPSADEILATLESGTTNLPKPLQFRQAPVETKADQYLQAAGTGASGVFLPGGAVPNLVGGVSGSVASEAAGDVTKGTKYEVPARIIAGLAGGLTGSVLANKAVASNVEQLISKATAGVTPDDWAAAMRLQAEAARRGTPVTSAEALAQVKGGNRTLQSIQRTVEQMPETAGTMDEFMAARPGANKAAVASQLDDISQLPEAPFEVGQKVQTAARQAVENVRKQINTLTDDAYRWGTDAMIPPAEFAPISENPIFQHFAAKVRADPLLGPAVSNLDDNSVAFVNAVKKEMDEAADSFTSFTSQSKSPERAMRVEQAQAPMVEAAKKSSPLYDEALSEQARLRQTELEPMKRGATGQLAVADDWRAQAKIILSDTPGSEKEIAAAVKSVSQTSPEAVPELLRLKLESMFNAAVPSAKGMTEQFRGANFAGKLLANPQQAKSLEAAIRALPNGDTAWTGFRRLLDVFEAQGQRLLPGSPTSFNQQLAGQLERNIGRGAKSLGTEIWANWNVQRRSQELARILTDPEGVALLRQLAVTGPNTARAQQLVQSFYQGGQGALPKETSPVRAVK